MSYESNSNGERKVSKTKIRNRILITSIVVILSAFGGAILTHLLIFPRPSEITFPSDSDSMLPVTLPMSDVQDYIVEQAYRLHELEQRFEEIVNENNQLRNDHDALLSELDDYQNNYNAASVELAQARATLNGLGSSPTIQRGTGVIINRQLLESDDTITVDGETFLSVRSVINAFNLPVYLDTNEDILHLGFREERTPLRQAAPHFDSNVGSSFDIGFQDSVEMGGIVRRDALTFSNRGGQPLAFQDII